MIVAGIDGGSRTIKVALWDTDERRLIGTAIRDDATIRAVILRGAQVPPSSRIVDQVFS